ncbi:MAG: hypothetical protein JWM71_1724, partial [Solirubrobacteraceae bacterium]|nr:hypothetical protein [Solirubrobacteraceae bacterium]
FGITVGKGAKAISFVYGGTPYSVGQSTIKLGAHDKKGSFSGTLIGGKGGPVSGSFTCG